MFGTAQSAHQVEGGNVNSDWWDWERAPGTPCREPSGDACDFYHRYREDIALMAGLGFGASGWGSSGRESSPRRASSRAPRSTTTGGCWPLAANSGSSRW